MASSVEIVKYTFAEKGAREGTLAGLMALGYRVHAKAVALCPVDEGQLRNSLMVKSDKEEALFNTAGGEAAPVDHKLTEKPEQDTVIVGTNSDHWYPEFGTRSQVAQPFLRPAGEMAKGASAASIMKKYGRESMEAEYKRRRVSKIG